MNLKDSISDSINKSAPMPKDDPDMDSGSMAAQQVLRLINSNERYKTDTYDRKWLAKWSVWIASLWLLVVIVVMIMSGLKYITISDTVMIAFLGTTTVNILGLSYIVLKGLFFVGADDDSHNNTQ